MKLVIPVVGPRVLEDHDRPYRTARDMGKHTPGANNCYGVSGLHCARRCYRSRFGLS
jgi:hypothetical protein